MDVETPLDSLVGRLRCEVHGPMVVRRLHGEAHIQIGVDAVMTVTVDDPGRPTFTVTYPRLAVKRNQDHCVIEDTSHGVVFEGVKWIARQLAEHGAVQPEFL